MQMLADPRVKLEELHIRRYLGGERSAILRLPAGAPEIHDEITRHLHGSLMPQILLYQRETEIDARADACGSPNLSVVDENRLGINANVRKAGPERIGSSPVCRSTAPR